MYKDPPATSSLFVQYISDRCNALAGAIGSSHMLLAQKSRGFEGVISLTYVTCGSPKETRAELVR